MSSAALEIDGNMFEGESWPVKAATSVTVLVATNQVRPTELILFNRMLN